MKESNPSAEDITTAFERLHRKLAERRERGKEGQRRDQGKTGEHRRECKGNRTGRG